MYKAHKWRKMARMGGWPFAAAMMSGADFGSNFGRGFSPENFTFEFGPRGGRRRRMFGSGELRLVLLHLLAEEPRHGYELIKAIEELTEGSYSPSPGTVYPTLSLLEDEGAIAQAPGDETRKAYEATEAGRKELEERADEVEALLDRLEGHGERRRAYATPEMFRAVGNLASVLKHRARSGKLDEKTVNEIVDLVDELARKIERL
ncbi:PadR family transcriptional regulator [Erythrobacter mangrovi]|nr:PadR family transcriptional regulator [Erythrobacter mangrovi]